MPDTLQQQKSRKRQSILNAAYDCFLEKGIYKASIDDIVKNANVAKGTFYLYFKDKADLLQQISINISKRVLIEAYLYTKQHEKENYIDNIITLVDYIIEYFKAHKLVLRMIERNFSWPLVKNEFDKEQDDAVMNEILVTLFENLQLGKLPKDMILKLLFCIVTLVGQVAYSSIIHGQPDTIDAMKPVLYEMIRKILTAPSGGADPISMMQE